MIRPLIYHAAGCGLFTEKQNEHKTDYLLIDYNHVYSDANNNVNMNYSYTNVTGNYKNDGTSENLFRYYYPSLNKHNSSNYYVANASKQRNGNLNATFIMRMAEVYLIAAEADIYLNGGANAAKYLNKVRERAGANPLTGSMTVRDVLDERGRELCGEYCRFYDLKRTGMFKSSDYLKDTHPISHGSFLIRIMLYVPFLQPLPLPLSTAASIKIRDIKNDRKTSWLLCNEGYTSQ